MDALEMPETLAGRGIEGKQRVSEEVVADAIAAVKIENCAPGRDEDDAVLGVEGHARPVVGRARVFHASGGQVS